MQTPGNDSPSAQHCLQCRARLAHDQRYCVECGTRRGPGRIVRPVAVSPSRSSPLPAPARPPAGRWTPNPIAAALAVMGMLGFGVIVGDVSGAKTLLEAASPSRSIVVDLPPSPRPAPVVPAAVSSSSSSASGSPAPPAATTPTTATTPSTASTPTPSASTVPGPLVLPPVKHVFLIVLSDQGFAQTFSPASKDRYLSRKLIKQGELVENYYGVASSSLANEIALVSGQGPTEQTQEDCPVYGPIDAVRRAKDHQIVGAGCIYPAATHNLASQLTADHATWKAYLEGLGAGPKFQLKDCGQPAIGSGEYTAPTRGDPYVAWRNPFAYFAALRKRSTCRRSDVPLGALEHDLSTAKTTPSLSFIVPGACDDGESVPCRRGAPSGLRPANAFLKRVLARIRASPAYQSGGLIAVTFDHAQQTGAHADPSACCSTPADPNLAGTPTTSTTPTTPYAIAPTTTAPYAATTTTAPVTGGETTPTGGGGQVGLLLISPYVKAGSSDLIDYFNHYSLLAGIESLFKLHRIADAGDLSLPRFPVELYDYHAS